MSLIPHTAPRYVAGRRIHHGLVGAALAFVGVVLAWDDRHDFPWKLTTKGSDPKWSSHQ